MLLGDLDVKVEPPLGLPKDHPEVFRVVDAHLAADVQKPNGLSRHPARPASLAAP